MPPAPIDGHAERQYNVRLNGDVIRLKESQIDRFKAAEVKPKKEKVTV